MKTKHWIFGLFAVTAAICSAFASIMPAIPIYIREDPDDALTAIEVNQDLCDGLGTTTCTVMVTNTAPDPDTQESRIAYSNSGATVELKHSTGQEVPSAPIFVSNP